MSKYNWMYFGCVGQPGHHLFNQQMIPFYDNKLHLLSHFDGLLPPRDSMDGYIASFSRLGAWGLSAIAFWDYSVDTRSASNSVFYVNSLTITPDEMMKEVKERFKELFKRFPSEVVFHPSVKEQYEHHGQNVVSEYRGSGVSTVSR